MKYIAHITLLLFVICAVPATANAQLVQCSGHDCGTCELIKLGDSVVDFIIMIMLVISALLFMYAGFLIVSAAGNRTKFERGKTIFTNVVIGLIIILASWLTIDLVMRSFADGGEFTVGSVTAPWNEILCRVPTEQADVSNSNSAPSFDSSRLETVTEPDDAAEELAAYAAANADSIGLSSGALANTAALAQLGASDITLKSGASLEGIQQSTIDGIIALQASAGVPIVITAGTDGSHADGTYSHANGYKLDLRTYDNPELVEYVESLTPAGSWSDGTQLYRDGNATYAIESDHIDVVYLPLAGTPVSGPQ